MSSKDLWVKYEEGKGWHVRGVPGYFTGEELHEYAKKQAKKQKSGNPNSYGRSLSCKEARKFIVDLIEALIDTKTERDFATHMCEVHKFEPACSVLKDVKKEFPEKINNIYVDLQMGLNEFKKCKIE